MISTCSTLDLGSSAIDKVILRLFPLPIQFFKELELLPNQ